MKLDLTFDPPWVNAAGSLGFAPDRHGPIDLARLGAFITHPISLEKRTPAHGDRHLSYPGGFLLHTGYPNPGLRTVIRRYGEGWGRSPVPVIVHLLCQRAEELTQAVQRLEGIPGVAGIELGLPPEIEAGQAVRLVQAATGELPVIVRLPLERTVDLAGALTKNDAQAEGLAALSLGPPRGLLPTPGGGWMRGRLYGQAVFPLALRAVKALSAFGVPVIGGGGVYRIEQAEAMLRAGAVAVQVDAVLWRGGW
jgi:dihydroorotate dehydrogenase (NAD+) catalytic subunit